MIRRIVGLFVFLLAVLQRTNGDELNTGFHCVNEMAELACPKDYLIFVGRVEHKSIASQCNEHLHDRIDYSKMFEPSLHNCLGVEKKNAAFTNACNGNQKCHVKIVRKVNRIGHDGTNCDFESKMANIYYTCVPSSMRAPFKSFDICDRFGPETILGVQSGFIHSPNYPDYYGNSMRCYVSIGVPNKTRLVIYLLSFNTEDVHFLSRNVNDYLLVGEEAPTLFGKLGPRVLFNSSDKESVKLRFVSDFTTFQSLAKPKGFLLFFTLTPLNISLNTTTTTTIAKTEPSITSTTVTSTTLKTTTTKEQIEERKFMTFQAESQKRSNLEEHHLLGPNGEKAATIITFLLGIIGILIVIIFALLFVYKRKQSQFQEEDVYEVNDRKSISSTTNDYQNGTYLGADQVELNEVSTSSKFQSRLRKFYHNLNKTLHKSAVILDKPIKESSILNRSVPNPQSDLNNADINKELSDEINVSKEDKLRAENIYAEPPVLFSDSPQQAILPKQIKQAVERNEPLKEGKESLYSVVDKKKTAVSQEQRNQVVVHDDPDIYHTINELNTDEEEEDCEILLERDACEMNNNADN